MAKAKKQFVPHEELRGMKVLVVDDNATSRNIFKDMLASFSFEVTLAASGEEGLSELENAPADRPFKLVIMDWMMSGLDGIETARRIKYHRSLGDIPAIIMATAYGREEVMRQAEKTGLEGFLIKPINASVLFDTIIQAFSRESSEDRDDGRLTADAEQGIERLAGARVLLVEDNVINQQVAKEILEGAGIAVSLADNGRQGVEAAARGDFDAILMDIQMPVMDGYAATREIRQNPRFRDLPIIAMTAHAMSGDADKSLAAGMNDHVTKPIDPAQLFAALQRWVAQMQGPRGQAVVTAAAVENPANVNDLPERLPGFDLMAGLKRLQGNRQLYRKLIIDFTTNYRNAAGEIRLALDNGNLAQSHHLVHSLKGAAGNLAAEQVHAVAMELESLLKSAASLPPAADLDAALDRMAQCLEEITVSAGRLGGGPEDDVQGSPRDLIAAIPIDLRREMAVRIREAADIGDVGALSTIAADLEARSADFRPLSQRLAGMADDFDLDGVLKLADELELDTER